MGIYIYIYIYIYMFVNASAFRYGVLCLSLAGAFKGADDAYSSGTPGHKTKDTAQQTAGCLTWFSRLKQHFFFL